MHCTAIQTATNSQCLLYDVTLQGGEKDERAAAEDDQLLTLQKSLTLRLGNRVSGALSRRGEASKGVSFQHLPVFGRSLSQKVSHSLVAGGREGNALGSHLSHQFSSRLSTRANRVSHVALEVSDLGTGPHKQLHFAVQEEQAAPSAFQSAFASYQQPHEGSNERSFTLPHTPLASAPQTPPSAAKAASPTSKEPERSREAGTAEPSSCSLTVLSEVEAFIALTTECNSLISQIQVSMTALFCSFLLVELL